MVLFEIIDIISYSMQLDFQRLPARHNQELISVKGTRSVIQQISRAFEIACTQMAAYRNLIMVSYIVSVVSL